MVVVNGLGTPPVVGHHYPSLIIRDMFPVSLDRWRHVSARPYWRTHSPTHFWVPKRTRGHMLCITVEYFKRSKDKGGGWGWWWGGLCKQTTPYLATPRTTMANLACASGSLQPRFKLYRVTSRIHPHKPISLHREPITSLIISKYRHLLVHYISPKRAPNSSRA